LVYGVPLQREAADSRQVTDRAHIPGALRQKSCSLHLQFMQKRRSQLVAI